MQTKIAGASYRNWFTTDFGWFGQYALPGFVGSLLMTVGALGVGWFPLSINILQWNVIEFLQTQTFGLALTRSFVVVGAALLLQAWLVVGVDALHEKISETGTLLVTFFVWCLPILFAPPLFSRDVYSYYMQGRMQLAGFNPYNSGVAVLDGWFKSGVDPLWGDSPTPYGPAFLLIERIVAYLSGESAMLAAYLFRFASLGSVILMCYYIPKLARQHGVNPVTALWLGVMNPLVIMHFIAGAHNDALMVGLLCMALSLSIDRKFLFAILIATFALAIKPVAIVALPFIALTAAGAGASWKVRIRFGAIAATSSFLTLFALSFVAGTGPFGWLASLSTPGTVKSWISPTTAAGMIIGGPIRFLGFGNHVDTAIAITRAIGSVFLLIVLIYLIAKPEGRSGARGTALSLAALVILGPVVQPWYLLWSIPLLAATGLTHRQVRILVLLLAAFTVHAIANSSATADTFLELSDGIAMLLAAVTLGFAVIASPSERKLILGDEYEIDMLPRSLDEQASADAVQL
jgi:hypothetical protein